MAMFAYANMLSMPVAFTSVTLIMPNNNAIDKFIIDFDVIFDKFMEFYKNIQS